MGRDKICIPQLWTYKLYNSYIWKCGPRPTLAENLLTKTHKQEKLNLRNAASKDTTLQSTQAFSTLPHTHGENEKLEIWKKIFLEKTGKIKCDFYSIILLMYHICAVLYGSNTVARSTN